MWRLAIAVCDTSEVSRARPLGGEEVLEARCVNGPFEPPLPDALPLVFQWEGPSEPGAGARLRFEVDVRATRHLGTSSASASRSFVVVLEEFPSRETFHSGGEER